jgi:hypothetical protein
VASSIGLSYGRPVRLLVASLFVAFWCFVALLDFADLAFESPLWFHALGATVLGYVIGLQGKTLVTSEPPSAAAPPVATPATPATDKVGNVERLVKLASQQGLALVLTIILVGVLIWNGYEGNQQAEANTLALQSIDARLVQMEADLQTIARSQLRVENQLGLPPLPPVAPDPTPTRIP